MSGVYIKGMELPCACVFCKLYEADLYWCRGAKKEVPYSPEDKRAKFCPLVPVPPHGRLIDADKQDAQIEALIERHLHGYTKSTWDFVCELRDILKRNRTIIPAEEDE